MITPLPEPKKPAYLEELIADAVAQGASVINSEEGGGTRKGALFIPAIVYPVTPKMRLFHEEQFGPVSHSSIALLALLSRLFQLKISRAISQLSFLSHPCSHPELLGV